MACGLRSPFRPRKRVGGVALYNAFWMRSQTRAAEWASVRLPRQPGQGETGSRSRAHAIRILAAIRQRETADPEDWEDYDDLIRHSSWAEQVESLPD